MTSILIINELDVPGEIMQEVGDENRVLGRKGQCECFAKLGTIQMCYLQVFKWCTKLIFWKQCKPSIGGERFGH